MSKKLPTTGNGQPSSPEIPITDPIPPGVPARRSDGGMGGGAQPLESRLPSQLVGGKKLPVVVGRDWPMWLEHCNDWELFKHEDGSFELLPVVGVIVLRPGSNQVIQPKSAGEPIGTGRVYNQFANVWGHVLFTKTDEFLRVIDLRTGPGYHLVWETFEQYPDGSVEKHFDHEGFARWRRSLYLDGRIPGPRKSVLQKIKRGMEKRIGRIEQDIHLPKAKRQFKIADARSNALAKAEAEFVKLAGGTR